MKHEIQFFLFSTDPPFINHAVAAGIDAIIVDWERRAKKERQAGFDTQIGKDTLEDLAAVSECTDARVICRINGYSEQTPDEVEAAIDAGANDIILPMVRSVEEVKVVLDQVRGRSGVGILIETEDAMSIASELGRLPLSIVYVGLNDLCIERRGRNIFTPLIDETVEEIRPHFPMPFGFGGLTLPDKGFPIPCRLLIAEMVRMRTDFSFLRRSFHSDIMGKGLPEGIRSMRAAIEKARARTPNMIELDRKELVRAVESSQAEPVG